MRVRTRTWTAGFAVGALLLAACGADDNGNGEPDDTGAAPDEPAEVDVDALDAETFAVTTLHPDGNWQATPWRALAEAVEEESGGQLDFEFHWAGALVPDAETVDGLSAGIADLGYPVYAYTPAEFPIDVWISELGFLADRAPVVGNLQSYAATLEWGFQNPEFIQELEDNGLAPLLPRIQLIPEYHLICTDPVTSQDDFNGLRVRTGGPAWANAAEALGMSTVTVATAEIFETMQRGVVDCSMNGFADFIGLGLWDAGSHATATGFAGWTSYGVAMGKPRWDALSPDARQIMWNNLDAYIETMLDNSLTEHHRFVIEGAERGLEFHELDDEARRAIDEYHEGVMQGIVDQAPDGLSDPQGMVDSYIELHEKWRDIALELGYETDQDNYFDWAEAQPADGHEVDVRPFVDRMVEEILVPNQPQ